MNESEMKTVEKSLSFSFWCILIPLASVKLPPDDGNRREQLIGCDGKDCRRTDPIGEDWRDGQAQTCSPDSCLHSSFSYRTEEISEG